MIMKRLLSFLLILMPVFVLLTSCYYQHQRMDAWEDDEEARDSAIFARAHHYSVGYNFIVQSRELSLCTEIPTRAQQLVYTPDSILVFKGDEIVVAEIDTLSEDSADHVWIKVARDQDTQGWIKEKELLPSVSPDDPISLAIYLFSGNHVWGTLLLIGVVLMFVVFEVLRMTRRSSAALEDGSLTRDVAKQSHNGCHPDTSIDGEGGANEQDAADELLGTTRDGQESNAVSVGENAIRSANRNKCKPLFKRGYFEPLKISAVCSPYPLLLCVTLSGSAVFYASIQLFVPQTWAEFYFHPTLNPFAVPALLSAFLLSMWLLLLFFFATVDDAVRQLGVLSSFVYLLTLLTELAVLYLFFSLSTLVYIGYPLFILFVVFSVRYYFKRVNPRYCCGECGKPMHDKGICSRCGAINE